MGGQSSSEPMRFCSSTQLFSRSSRHRSPTSRLAKLHPQRLLRRPCSTFLEWAHRPPWGRSLSKWTHRIWRTTPARMRATKRTMMHGLSPERSSRQKPLKVFIAKRTERTSKVVLASARKGDRHRNRDLSMYLYIFKHGYRSPKK